MDKDWIKKNWSFLSARGIKYIDSVGDLFDQKDLLLSGKFFGTAQVFNSVEARYRCINKRGQAALLLRPYVFADMPEGVAAVYIDPKRYIISDTGEIKGLKSTYEHTIYAIKSGM